MKNIFLFILWGSLLLFPTSQFICQADEIETSPEVKKVIDKALNGLMKETVKPSEAGLILYTLMKSDIKPDHPMVSSTLDIILKKFESGSYVPVKDHIYEAAVDSLGILALDKQKYKKQAEQILDYIYSNQGDHGSWFYNDQRNIPAQRGDTSMAQYALLSLWNGSMSGIDIKSDSLNRVAKWFLEYQDKDGGFYYHPHNPSHVKSLSMTAAGVSGIGIIRLMFYGDRAFLQNEKTLGVLTTVRPTTPVSKSMVQGNCDYSALILDNASDKGIEWLVKNYSFAPNEKLLERRFIYYYCYTLERMSAIQNMNNVGRYDWYEDGFNVLRKYQAPSGVWIDGIDGYVASDTCFSILFLKRTTNKILQRNKPNVGGGLLIGGRGLPDDLQDVSRSGNGGISVKKSLGSMDDLLAELEKAETVDLEATQQAIVETVQLGKPEDLIGQRDKLLKLVDNKDPDIRRTALWALSRCSVLEDAGVFVKKLDDPNLEVAVEARNGLCWLSRQIKGLGEPANPSALINKNQEWDSLSDEEKLPFIKKWRLDVKAVWEKWYYKNRPYALRDDLEEPIPKENAK